MSKVKLRGLLGEQFKDFTLVRSMGHINLKSLTLRGEVFLAYLQPA